MDMSSVAQRSSKAQLQSALLSAIKAEHDLEVVRLLEARAEIDNHTYLTAAVSNGSASMVKILLEAKANLNISAIESPLCIAAKQGNLELINMLIEAGADLEPNKGLKPIHCAMRDKQPEAVKALIEAGADPSQALLQALKQEDLKMISLLLEAGADVNFEQGVPLKNAVLMEYLEGIHLLLEAGAQVASHNYRALRFAIIKGYPEIVEILLNSDQQLKNLFPSAAGYAEIFKILNEAKIPQANLVKIFLENDQDISFDDPRSFDFIETELMKYMFFAPVFEYLTSTLFGPPNILKAGSIIQVFSRFQFDLTPDNINFKRRSNKIFVAALNEVSKINYQIHAQKFEPVDWAWLEENSCFKVLSQSTYTVDFLSQLFPSTKLLEAKQLKAALKPKCYQKFVNKFDVVTYQTIKFYTYHGDQIMNSVLRGVEPEEALMQKHPLSREQIIEQINLLNQTIWQTDFCPKTKIVLFRGFSHASPLSIGSIINDQHGKFVSFTANPLISSKFSENLNVVYQLEIEPGANIKILPLTGVKYKLTTEAGSSKQDLTKFANEKEWLLPLGTTFEVTGWPQLHKKLLVVPIKIAKQEYFIFNGQINQLANLETGQFFDYLADNLNSKTITSDQ